MEDPRLLAGRDGRPIVFDSDMKGVKRAPADLYRALKDNRPGETVAVKVIRGKAEVSLPLALSERS